MVVVEEQAVLVSLVEEEFVVEFGCLGRFFGSGS